jgi:hypothetical protein
MPGWHKWLPSHKTSPLWYETEHFTALIAAYLNRERTNGRQGKTLREFVSEFDGLTTSAKQKDHLLAVVHHRHQVDSRNFWYKRICGEASGLPFVLQTRTFTAKTQPLVG